MNAQIPGASFNATGAVLVASFVIPDSTTPYSVVQATGPDSKLIGVSQQGSYPPPGSLGADSTLCTPPSPNTPTASNPFQIGVYQSGSICRLQLSANCAAVTNGSLLTSDRNGTAIDIGNPAIADKDVLYAGAMSLESGSAGQFIRVFVLAPFPIGPAAFFGVVRVSLTPTVVGPFSTSDQTFSVAGLDGNPNTPVVVSAEGLTANIVIGNAIMVSQGSIKIRFGNLTAASIVPSAQFYDIASLG